MRHAILAAVVLGVAGCQVYLAGGPAGAPPPDEDPATRRAPAAGAPPAAHPDAPVGVPAIAPPAAPRRVTFPGEQYFRAGSPRTLLLAAEDVLAAHDYRILRSGTLARGAELQAERRERLTTHPPTTTSPAWRVTAATIRIAGSTSDDCCYVTAGFTASDLSSRGDVLGIVPAHDPANRAVRDWFFDRLAGYLRDPHAR